MDGFGVGLNTEGGGFRRVRLDGGNTETWPIGEAEELAFASLRGARVNYVTFGDGGDGVHEFRMYREGVTSYGNYKATDRGPRWSSWYVDAEINGRRWIYRPAADLDDFETADEVGEELSTLYPDVTRIYVGNVETGEEQSWETREG